MVRYRGRFWFLTCLERLLHFPQINLQEAASLHIFVLLNELLHLFLLPQIVASRIEIVDVDRVPLKVVKTLGQATLGCEARLLPKMVDNLLLLKLVIAYVLDLEAPFQVETG